MAEFQDVAALDDIEQGVPFALTIDGVQVILCRDGEEVYAVEDRCSHMDVKLRTGSLEGAEITCKAHGARFDLKSGKALCMPAVTPIKTYEAQVEAGRVLVALS